MPKDQSRSAQLAAEAAELLDQPGETALDEAAELLRQGVAVATDIEQRGEAQAMLSNVLYEHFNRTVDWQYLDLAIDANRAAAVAFPADAPEAGMVGGNLAGQLAVRFGHSRDPADLTEAIEAGQRAASVTALRGNTRAGVVANLAAALHERYLHAADPADLEQAVALGMSSIDLAPQHTEVGGHLSNLGKYLLTRFLRGADPSDLDASIGAHCLAVEMTSPDHWEWYKYCGLAAEALMQRASRAASLADVSTASKLLAGALDRIPADHPEFTGVIGSRNAVVALADRLVEDIGSHRSTTSADRAVLIDDLVEWAQTSGDATASATAISLLRGILAALPANHPLESHYLANLAVVEGIHYERTGSLESLGAALEQIRSALQRTPPGHDELSSRLNILAANLNKRYHLLGDVTDLDESVTIARQALAAEQDFAEHPYLRSNLASFLHDLFHAKERAADLDEAIDCSRSAVAATPATDPNWARRLGKLAEVLLQRYHLANNVEDLSESITTAEDAAAALTGHGSYQRRIISVYGHALLTRFEIDGRPGGLDTAIEAHRTVLAATPVDHPARSHNAYQLALALSRRFERTADAADFETAFTCCGEAVETSGSEGHRDSAVRLLGYLFARRPSETGKESNVAIARAMYILAMYGVEYRAVLNPLEGATAVGKVLLQDYEKNGRAAALDEAVTRLRLTLQRFPADKPEQAECRAILALALLKRFEISGDHDELYEAVDMVSAGDETSWRLAIRGAALNYRYIGSRNRDDLDEAIATLRRVLTLESRESAPSARTLSNLGGALRERFEAGGGEDDLDEAVTHCRSALTLDPDNPAQLSNLGGALRRKAELTKDAEGLTESVEVLTKCADLMERSAAAQVNLGNALLSRYDRAKSPDDLAAAIRRWRAAADMAHEPPITRLRAAQQWGDVAAQTGQFDSAAEGYRTAIRLVSTAVWRGAPRGAQERRLALLGGLATNAAATQIGAGHADVAVELLEQGRSVLWSEALHTHTAMAELRRTAPQLAARLSEIMFVLQN
ncbi:hypothetical protein ACFYV7_39095 [Nocardia suismassiliense]|uniref:Tetratricopeptide repeat protein n=1 Tax=Nocardia suismassiliense TaxID=2077092 RepID=A0ABW6R5P9_9NOCA